MAKGKWSLIAFGCVLAAISGAPAVQAHNPHRNYLTFSGAVALPGTTLPPGTYLFEVVVPGGAGDVVSVSSRNGQQYFLGFTREVPRPRALKASGTVAFGEARPGNPPPIAVWYPLGGSRGHQFVYPGAR
jgi:hypothetical protein